MRLGLDTNFPFSVHRLLRRNPFIVPVAMEHLPFDFTCRRSPTSVRNLKFTQEVQRTLIFVADYHERFLAAERRNIFTH
ncbi:MAG: hypothetical protein KF746_10025 [Chitinophagaceae bacterium]|nr:hypothetical protein [Chitinophagaceae bacterium]